MLDVEAIDAKVNRARGELRLLEMDIVAFCEEKARLIVPEDYGEELWWVYRGDDPNPPIDWSVRVGEFAYNLRSSLDHLVWQLAESNGASPEEARTYFPIRRKPDDEPTLEKDPPLEGIRREDKKYIRSIQPHMHDTSGTGHRLSNLNAIGNIDKHRRILMTNVRWDGIDPEIRDRASLSQKMGTGGKVFASTGQFFLDPCRLVHGRRLLQNPGLRDSEYPVFRIEAVFEEADIEGEKWSEGLTVPETLNECLAGVELVIAHFKENYRAMSGGTA